MPKLRDRNCRDVRVKAVSDFINGDIWRVTVLDTRFPRNVVTVATYVGKGAHPRAAAHAKRLRASLKVKPQAAETYDEAATKAVMAAMDAMSTDGRYDLMWLLNKRWDK